MPRQSSLDKERPLLTTLGFVNLLVITLVVVSTVTERYLDPVGEKYVPILRPGAADFALTFSGARALVRGENPYHNTLPELRDRWDRGIEIDGKFYNVLYPPSQLLLYVPLAKLIDNPRQAGRLFFWVNLALLLGLSVATWWLVVTAGEASPNQRRLSLLLIPLLFFILSCNVGSFLGLERGQSDILGSALCWSAVVLYLKGWRFVPALFTVSTFLMKGYSLFLGLGLLLLSPHRDFKRLFAGALFAIVLLLVPVLDYVDEGIVGARWSAGRFTGKYWYNHGFKNLFYNLSPPLAEPGRIAMTGASLVVAAAFWINARRALKKEQHASATLWLALFATAALLIPVGYAAGSFIYNQILLLPGTLLFLLLGREFAEASHLPHQALPILGTLQILAGFALFKYRLGSETLPIAALGFVLLILVWGGGLLRLYASSRRKPSTGARPI